MTLQEWLQELRHFQALPVPCPETLMREVRLSTLMVGTQQVQE
jgi:hypothetical protein